MRTILEIIKKEFAQFKRDPKMFGVILVAPVMQLVFLGFAATLDVKVIKTYILDNDRSDKSAELIREFSSSEYFRIDGYVADYNELTKVMDGGNALIAFVIPEGFEKDLESGKTAELQAIINGSDGNTSSIASGYALSVISAYSNKIMMNKLEMRGVKQLPAGRITADTRVWYNPMLLSRYFMVPGIVGLLLTVITLILTSLAIVKEKEIGTLEQIIVTPIKPYQIIAGKLIPFVIMGFISVVIVITAMRVIFGIEIRGSLVFLFISAFFYIFTTLGLGLLISTITKNQQQAMMVAMFGVMMPMVFLSGFNFPVENMPKVFQYISDFISLKYFLNIIRGVILKGSGFTDHIHDFIMIILLGTLILSISILRFNKRLE